MKNTLMGTVVDLERRLLTAMAFDVAEFDLVLSRSKGKRCKLAWISDMHD